MNFIKKVLLKIDDDPVLVIYALPIITLPIVPSVMTSDDWAMKGFLIIIWLTAIGAFLGQSLGEKVDQWRNEQ